MGPVTVYLDSSVLIPLLDGRNERLRGAVEKTLREGTHVFPYSATQLSEITTAETTERTSKRLDYIEHISQGHYFANSVNERGFRLRRPRVVHATIHEVAVPNLHAMFASLMPHEQFSEARKAFGLAPNEINNIPSAEIVQRIDRALAATASGQGAPRSLADLVAITRVSVAAAFSSQWKRLGQSEEHELRNLSLIALFTMLNVFGYWPDDKRTHRKGSLFPDSQHVFDASHYQMLLSHDKGMLNRAAAAYHVLGISTRVVPDDQFPEESCT